jgi:hypothetical protein
VPGADPAPPSSGQRMIEWYEFAKQYSLFLLVGVVAALAAANAVPDDYE